MEAAACSCARCSGAGWEVPRPPSLAAAARTRLLAWLVQGGVALLSSPGGGCSRRRAEAVTSLAGHLRAQLPGGPLARATCHALLAHLASWPLDPRLGGARPLVWAVLLEAAPAPGLEQLRLEGGGGGGAELGGLAARLAGADTRQLGRLEVAGLDQAATPPVARLLQPEVRSEICSVRLPSYHCSSWCSKSLN